MKYSMLAEYYEKLYSTSKRLEKTDILAELLKKTNKKLLTKIFDEQNNEIGKITSGTFGPSVQSSVAMGYVANTFSKINTKIFLEIRGNKYPANICNLPFFKKNYVKGATNE